MLRGRTPATPGGGADRHADRDVRATRAWRNPGIAIDFIEVEHAAVLRATRAGAEPRQCLAALDDPGSVASLLARLREAGAHEQAAAPAFRRCEPGLVHGSGA